MNYSVDQTGQRVLDLASSTESSLCIVAPFIKDGAIKRILDHLPSEAELVVVSRWQVLEIRTGVSDLEVWPRLRDRGDSLRLLPRLHTKIFANENSVLVGSANVTRAGLGWSPSPNDEALVQPSEEDEIGTRQYISSLVARSVAVDDELHNRFVELVAALPVSLEPWDADLVEPEATGSGSRSWLPQSRDPEDVLRFYQGVRSLTATATQNAHNDLRALEPPGGLSEDQLRAYIDAALMQHPLVSELRIFLTNPHRFGEVVRFVGDRTGCAHSEATVAWQTMLRWLVLFQPGRWNYEKPRHSEILTFRN